jgi:phenylacetate-CoA ligase
MGFTGRQFMLNRFVAPSDLLDFMRSNEIGYLVTRPIEAHALALEALAHQSEVRLRGILGVGTAIRTDEKADCVSAFGGTVVTPYGAKEGGQMAFPCPVTGHYHLSEENVFIEVVDEQDQPCASGQVGRVIVTPLYNFAQPFIRYEQGDLAILGEPCVCGRTLRVLTEIVGRQEHLFQFPGGRKFAMTINYDLMEEFGVRNWQIAQTGPLSIEVRYVPRGAQVGDSSAISEAIKAKAQRDDIAVSFTALDEIARQPGGKILSYVYEVPRSVS